MPSQLGEITGKFVPEGLKAHIPLRATSLDQFVEFVGGRGGTVVEVEPAISVEGGSTRSIILNRSGFFEYATRYTSHTQQGRKIVFREVYLKEYGSQGGILVSKGDISSVRLFLTTETRIHEIQQRLPQAEIKGSTLEMSKAERKEMLDFAKKHNIAQFSKSQ